MQTEYYDCIYDPNIVSTVTLQADGYFDYELTFPEGYTAYTCYHFSFLNFAYFIDSADFSPYYFNRYFDLDGICTQNSSESGYWLVPSATYYTSSSGFNLLPCAMDVYLEYYGGVSQTISFLTLSSTMLKSVFFALTIVSVSFF